MILCVILAVLSAFPFHQCVSSARIKAADGCIYDGVPDKSSMFTYRVSGSGPYSKQCPQNHVFNKRVCDCIRDPDMAKSTPSEPMTKTSSPDFGTTTANPSSPKSPAYGVYISQSLRYFRAKTYYKHFRTRYVILAAKPFHQGFTVKGLVAF